MKQTLCYEIAVPVCPACGGKWVYYDGCLGYESMVCEKCSLDINDIKLVITKGA